MGHWFISMPFFIIPAQSFFINPAPSLLNKKSQAKPGFFVFKRLIRTYR